MAYQSFLPWSAEHGATIGPAVSSVEASRFTAVELRVIGLGEQVDVTRELSHRSRRGRFLQWAFGVKLDRPLADPRLESLRRFTSLASHHREQVGEAEVRELVQAGYSEGQALGLLTYFAARQQHSYNEGYA